MEVETEKVSRFKSKKFWLKVAAGFILFSIVYGMGSSAAKVELEDTKVKYDELVYEIQTKEDLLSDVEKDLTDLQEDVKKHKSDYEKAMEVVANKQAIESEIATLTKDVDSKKAEITELDKTITTKKGELASIEGSIKAKKDAPKNLSAGTYIVGVDVPASRYKAVPLGNGSNFVVYSASGNLEVNTILGKGSFDEPEYIFFADEGDVIETHSSVQLIPVH